MKEHGASHRRSTPTGTPEHDCADVRLLLRVDEAARLLGIGTTLAYEMVGQGRLPHVRLGRAVRIPLAALEAWIAARTRGADDTMKPAADAGAGARGRR